jgi:hypothetical protein
MSDTLLLIATPRVLRKRKEILDCWPEIGVNMRYPATGYHDTDSLSFLHPQLNGEMGPNFQVGNILLFMPYQFNFATKL